MTVQPPYPYPSTKCAGPLDRYLIGRETIGTPKGATRRGASRPIKLDEMNGGSPISFIEATGRTFTSGEALARFIGRRRGLGNTSCSTSSNGIDGIAWWLLSDLDALARNESARWFQFVLTLTEVDDGDRAEWTLLAFRAAGLIVKQVPLT